MATRVVFEPGFERAVLIEATPGLRALLARLGNRVLSVAVALCPVDTGRLRSSIEMVFVGVLAVRVGTNVEYALYVEMGTRDSPAQPFLRPALASLGPDV